MTKLVSKSKPNNRLFLIKVKFDNIIYSFIFH